MADGGGGVDYWRSSRCCGFSLEGVDNDCIIIGHCLRAFLQAPAFDEDLPATPVSYRPYTGAKLRIFKLPGRPYGMSQVPMDWCTTLHGWMTETGFNRIQNGKAAWYHSSGVRKGSHVDDCL